MLFIENNNAFCYLEKVCYSIMDGYQAKDI